MEPFITRDGRYLFFNNRNDPRVDTNLHYAERVDDATFDYRGELRGANSPALDGAVSRPLPRRRGERGRARARRVAAARRLAHLRCGDLVGGALPKSADIAVAVRDGAGFRRHPASAEFMRNVNTAALEYAPAISADLLELFFTRATASGPVIYRSHRPNRDVPFGVAERVAVISGFVEGPTLSADGRSLYYHKLEGQHYVIYRVTRP